MRLRIVFGLFGLLLANALTAGPWPQKKGNGYFKLSEWWIVFDEHYTDTGLKDPNVTTGIFNTALYAEYGLTDRLTAITYIPFFSRNYMNNLRSVTTEEILVPGEALNSFGDTNIGLKYGLTKPGAKVPISATVTLGLPTGKTTAGALENLQTGDGEFNQMIQVDAGYGFNLGKNTGSYVSGYAGFNHRTNGFSEEIRLGLEYGVGFMNRKLWLIGKLNVMESLKNGETAETATSTSIFANNNELTSATFEVAYNIWDNVGLAGAITAPIRGEIIAAAPSYSFGVYWTLRK